MKVPRLFGLYHARGKVVSFEQWLANLFEPLFEVAADPSSHPKLHLFLQQARVAHTVCVCACVPRHPLTHPCAPLHPLAPPCTLHPLAPPCIPSRPSPTPSHPLPPPDRPLTAP